MKPSIPKGTRDFSPVEMVRRNYILDTIKTVYQRYGYQQIETPAMENLLTLEGKYGEEGDKLLFRILNSGPVIEEIRNQKSEVNISDITEKGLRYDLTVPFARYVVMHQNEITFPFKRYQIQPVWRADRPQKGRYREFYQCDADVIGSDSLLNEVEMIQMIDEVFSKLGIGVTIKINNRKVLQGIAEYYNISHNRYNEFYSILDKIDKIGVAMAEIELIKNNFGEINLINLISPYEPEKNDPLKMLSVDFRVKELKEKFANKNVESGIKGMEEVEHIVAHFSSSDIGKFKDYWYEISNSNTLVFDTSLARGLNYYTGSIFEVKVNDTRSTFTGSLLGGGRYDDLTGIFGLPNVSGVGISFGVDRIYDVMVELNLFPFHEFANESTRVLFLNFGGEEEKKCLELLSKTRALEINAEIYPDPISNSKQIKKQFSYADAKKIPYVIIFGAEERKEMSFKIKNLGTRNEYLYKLDEFDKILEGIKERSII